MGLNMGNRLYDLMDWPSIEGVVYSECDEPMELLGGRICKDGFLIQTFAPDAVPSAHRIQNIQRLQGQSIKSYNLFPIFNPIRYFFQPMF